MSSQRSDTEKYLIEDGKKKIGIDEIIKWSEIINKNLRSQI